MKHNSKTNAIENNIRLFVNDFESALKKSSGKPIDLINGSNKEELNKLINKYLQEHFILKINGKVAKFDFIGFEIEKEICQIFIEYKKIKSIKSAEIDCTLLYDFIDKQSNIIRLESATGEQTQKLNYPEKLAKFSY